MPADPTSGQARTSRSAGRREPERRSLVRQGIRAIRGYIGAVGLPGRLLRGTMLEAGTLLSSPRALSSLAGSRSGKDRNKTPVHEQNRYTRSRGLVHGHEAHGWWHY